MHPRSDRPRLCLAAVATAAPIAALIAPAAADVAVANAGEERIVLPTSAGLETFLVQQPDAAASPASRVNDDLADKQGAIPAPTAGYELSGVVIVRTHAPGVPPQVGPAGQVAAAAQIGGPTVTPFAGLPGWWLVSAGSVRKAAALALALRADPAVAEAFLDIRRPQPLRNPPTDPGYVNQWHLRNTEPPGNDLNVEPVWKMPFTGAGVTVGIIEDGWNTTHPDLAPNYDAAASQNGSMLTSHGTSVAGLVAAAAGNGLGGVGVAYGARISKLYRGFASANATAFLHRNDLNFVKNNSWGPPDTGQVAPITPLERSALEESVNSGRDGLGTVIVWASGNGAEAGDRVDYDPYASSRFVIAVGATDDDDTRAPYSEGGSALLVVAPSSGSFSGDRGIYTTTGTTFYTASFGGTSAAAPMVAGIAALMLEARPELTWRDVKHILARTARRCDPDNPGWETNAAGLPIHYDYGLGAADAAAAVSLARTWTLVGPELEATTGVMTINTPIPDNDPAGISHTATITTDLRIESVEVELSVAHPYIGDLRIELIAPSGTRSLLAVPRNDPTDDYAAHVFTTVRHWDERSAGDWTLTIADAAGGDAGVWTSWKLTVYGTALCEPDWNGDGAVNSADISAFLTSWLSSLNNSDLNADFDRSGAVNSADISAFLAAWLEALGGC